MERNKRLIKINNMGFNLVEIMISTALISFTVMQASTLAVFFNQKKINHEKNLENLESVEILSKILSSEDKCSANFLNKSTVSNIAVDEVYDIKPDKSLNTAIVQFENNNPDVEIYIDHTKKENHSGFSKSTLVVKSKNNQSIKEIPFYFSSKKSNPNQIETCSTGGLLGIDNDVATVCNAENQGALKYDFAEEKTLTCINNVWTTSERTAGSYSHMLAEYSCVNPNPRTGKCSCPNGYFAQKVYSFENYGCLHGVLDQWYDVETEENKVVSNGKCGVMVKLCIRW